MQQTRFEPQFDEVTVKASGGLMVVLARLVPSPI